MPKKQESSEVMGGYKGGRFGAIAKAAAAAGSAPAVKKKHDEPMEVPPGNPKSLSIKAVLGGYKVCWTKPGQWQEEEAVAKDLDEAMEIAKAYLEGAENG